ncbi:MAG: hypothetical protein ABIG71_04195 [Candidatus Uhrbacteria bacterium]
MGTYYHVVSNRPRMTFEEMRCAIVNPETPLEHVLGLIKALPIRTDGASVLLGKESGERTPVETVVEFLCDLADTQREQPFDREVQHEAKKVLVRCYVDRIRRSDGKDQRATHAVVRYLSQSFEHGSFSPTDLKRVHAFLDRCLARRAELDVKLLGLAVLHTLHVDQMSRSIWAISPLYNFLLEHSMLLGRMPDGFFPLRWHGWRTFEECLSMRGSNSKIQEDFREHEECRGQFLHDIANIIAICGDTLQVAPPPSMEQALAATHLLQLVTFATRTVYTSAGYHLQ